MNTGISFATSFTMKWIDKDQIVEKNFSLLDSYSTSIPKISLFEYVRLKENEVRIRSKLILNYLCNLYGVSYSLINEPAEKSLSTCPLISQRKEFLSKDIETSLIKRNDNFIISTDTDEVKDYHLSFDISKVESEVQEVDCLKVLEGELIVKVGTSRSKIVFDINDDGELIVIGEDAANYELNNQGELLYNLASNNK